MKSSIKIFALTVCLPLAALAESLQCGEKLIIGTNRAEVAHRSSTSSGLRKSRAVCRGRVRQLTYGDRSSKEVSVRFVRGARLRATTMTRSRSPLASFSQYHAKALSR